MHRITRRRSPSRFSHSRRRTLAGGALAVVLALALGGSAIAEHVDLKSPPVEGAKRTYYVFTAMHSKLNLNVGGASTKNGAEIGQWNDMTNQSSMNEQWEFLTPSADGYMIRNRWSRQCVTSPSNVEGAAIVQRPCEGTANQRWQINRTSGSLPIGNLRNPATGFDLNIAGGSQEMGAKLIQYRHVNGAKNAIFHWGAGEQVTD
jgi:Ricin-type beta-trefoil lectin domain-like